MTIDSIQTVDLPVEVDFAKLTEAQDAPIREATANFARGMVHGARRARQVLDEIPQSVDSYLPIWAKIPLLPVLVSTGLSIGIFRRTYDTVSNLPVAFMSVAEGRVSFADVGRGMWQMVKNDASAIPEVAELMYHGQIMTAESRVGEVAFDVIPFATGVGGALKTIPQTVARIATEGIEASAIAARGAIATFNDMAESVAQTMSLEPELAMAGGQTFLPESTSALDQIRAGAMAMSKHLDKPRWQTAPIGLAKSPGKNWRPPTIPKKTPKIATLSSDRMRIVNQIKLHWGLDGMGEAQLRSALSRMGPDVSVQPDSFRMIFDGRVPRGAQTLGDITSKGTKYTVCYNPANSSISLVIQ